MTYSNDDQDRFWSKVAAGSNGCIMWTGSSLRGYGRFKMPQRPHYAHRVAYELAYGPISEALQADHLCRVAGCVNHLHLEAVTQTENLRRSAEANGVRQYAAACPSGHVYDERNTHYRPNGWRICRTCIQKRNAANYRKRISTS